METTTTKTTRAGGNGGNRSQQPVVTIIPPQPQPRPTAAGTNNVPHPKARPPIFDNSDKSCPPTPSTTPIAPLAPPQSEEDKAPLLPAGGGNARSVIRMMRPPPPKWAPPTFNRNEVHTPKTVPQVKASVGCDGSRKPPSIAASVPKARPPRFEQAPQKEYSKPRPPPLPSALIVGSNGSSSSVSATAPMTIVAPPQSQEHKAPCLPQGSDARPVARMMPPPAPQWAPPTLNRNEVHTSKLAPQAKASGSCHRAKRPPFIAHSVPKAQPPVFSPRVPKARPPRFGQAPQTTECNKPQSVRDLSHSEVPMNSDALKCPMDHAQTLPQGPTLNRTPTLAQVPRTPTHMAPSVTLMTPTPAHIAPALAAEITPSPTTIITSNPAEHTGEGQSQRSSESPVGDDVAQSEALSTINEAAEERLNEFRDFASRLKKRRPELANSSRHLLKEVYHALAGYQVLEKLVVAFVDGIDRPSERSFDRLLKATPEHMRECIVPYEDVFTTTQCSKGAGKGGWHHHAPMTEGQDEETDSRF